MKALISTNPQAIRVAKLCPRCGSKYVHRSHHQGMIDLVFRAVLLRPFRCEDCDGRFYRRAS
jgi:ribosomal protein L33